VCVCEHLKTSFRVCYVGDFNAEVEVKSGGSVLKGGRVIHRSKNFRIICRWTLGKDCRYREMNNVDRPFSGSM